MAGADPVSTLGPRDIYREMLTHPEALEQLEEIGLALLPAIPPALIDEALALSERMPAVASVLGMNLHSALPANVLRRIAWNLALAGAAFRRKRWFCPHAWGVEHVTYVLLSEGLAFCDVCKGEVEALLTRADDGRCDVCDKRTSIFYDTALQDTFVLTTANICESCHAFLRRVMDEEHG